MTQDGVFSTCRYITKKKKILFNVTITVNTERQDEKKYTPGSESETSQGPEMGSVGMVGGIRVPSSVQESKCFLLLNSLNNWKLLG